MPNDLIEVIERAYSLDGTEQQWLAGLAAAARPILDRGLGTLAFAYRARVGQPLEIVASAGAAISPGLLGTVIPFNQATPAEIVESTYLRRSGCATASEVSRLGRGLEQHPAWQQVLHPHGMRDYCAVNVLVGPLGRGCIVGAPLTRISRTAPALRHAWDRVAAHIAAGMRLRQQLGNQSPSDGAAAILASSGRVEHAEGEARSGAARENLRRAAQHFDRARGRLRRESPQQALELWQALISGQWSLIEHFERDGRRYLVARRNEPDVRDPRALTPRERQVAWYAALGHPNKLIGYELGLGTSSVATHLTHAMQKLGIRTRAELIALVRALTSDK